MAFTAALLVWRRVTAVEAESVIITKIRDIYNLMFLLALKFIAPVVILFIYMYALNLTTLQKMQNSQTVSLV